MQLMNYADLMKRILSIFLTGACGTAIAQPDTITQEYVLSLPDAGVSTNVTRLHSKTPWQQGLSTTGNTTAQIVGADLGAYATEGGYFWGLSNSNNAQSTDFSGVSATAFSFLGRQAYGGEYVALSLKVSDILAGTGSSGGSTLTGMQFSCTISDAATCFSIWSYNTVSQEATAIRTPVAVGTVNENFSGLNLGENDMIYVVWGRSSAGSSVSVSDISMKASISSVVPEPGTATLGLLSLAGLLVRRRR